VQSTLDLDDTDFRKGMGKFQQEQLDKNVVLLKEVEVFAAKKGLTLPQLAIAWLVAKGAAPIPGTKKIKYIEQNIAAAQVDLTADDLEGIEGIISIDTETGSRSFI